MKALIGFLVGCWLSATALAQSPPGGLVATIDSERGTMQFMLRPDIAPLTVANFVNLATRGYYDGLTFHRVEPNFMAQGGDPVGNGSGGPGYQFKDEIILRLNQEGILAMANAGPGTNGSQFFITHQATPHLNGLHTVFGLITTGKEIVRTIRRGDVINSVTISGDVVPLLESQRTQVEEWNRKLDEGFPQLRPSLLPATSAR